VNLETRSYVTDFELRTAGDGRTLRVLAAPFDRPAHIVDFLGEYDETIARGAFATTIRERGHKVRVFTQHDVTKLPIGRPTSLREDAAGLVAELRIARTAAGDDALALVADGVLDGVSIGFTAVQQRWSPDRRRRTLDVVALRELSLVSEAAYAEAKVLAVRSARSPSLAPLYAVLLDRRKVTL
jgi:HK97 family phage prohead protease